MKKCRYISTKKNHFYFLLLLVVHDFIFIIMKIPFNIHINARKSETAQYIYTFLCHVSKPSVLCLCSIKMKMTSVQKNYMVLETRLFFMKCIIIKQLFRPISSERHWGVDFNRYILQVFLSSLTDKWNAVFFFLSFSV